LWVIEDKKFVATVVVTPIIKSTKTVISCIISTTNCVKLSHPILTKHRWKIKTTELNSLARVLILIFYQHIEY
jgi:hypothetical protein